MQPQAVGILWIILIFALVPFSLYGFLRVNSGLVHKDYHLPGEQDVGGRIPLGLVNVDFNSTHLRVYAYTYHNEQSNVTHRGKMLLTPEDMLEKHKLPLKTLKHLNQSNVMSFVFVMASQASRFSQSMDAIRSIQELYPNHTILYYDWGLLPEQVVKLERLCQVQRREMNLSDYPGYRDLVSFIQMSKIFCIMESLIDHNGVFWVDTTVRLKDRNVIDLAFDRAISSDGFVFLSKAPHSSLSATHSTTYRYFPTDKMAQRAQVQAGTYAMLIYKTKKVFHNILWWWFLCSLNTRCISPVDTLDCNFSNNSTGHCHRFDQSVSNILASNLYGHNATEYSMDVKYRNGLITKRVFKQVNEPLYCDENKP
ncbi:hypothetical protein CAPTEDRAFT_185639 [Capitella teleta]|uniref:Uncharacterized protein n=1 Tax=Capitella teleta TaxID=283909 RepID=R7UC58_CAPTE|nr:hypothetical protein CAPTEDRAFT_185639 [Capitella teleta]|eukprot:ELU03574.1 hypothetical protein CAPTEDRAFT_185639 [Capitella teleta]